MFKLYPEQLEVSAFFYLLKGLPLLGQRLGRGRSDLDRVFGLQPPPGDNFGTPPTATYVLVYGYKV